MFNRFFYRVYLFSRATGHWLRRRLTPGGWLVLIGLLITAGLGADIERTIAYQAFALLFALLGMAILCAPFFRLRISAQRILPRFGTVGQPLVYSILLRHQAARSQAGLVLLENLADAPVTFEEFVGQHVYSSQKSFRLARSGQALRRAIVKEVPLPALLPRNDTRVDARLIPLKRGPLRLAGLTVARADPLGLFRSFINIPAAQTALILPRRYALPPIALPGTRKYQLGGVALAMSIGESEEFVALRDYRRGDPVRHIHWKSWAKVGKPIVREFEDEFFVRHALILDTFALPNQIELFEEAVSVAASFACTVNTQESLLDLLFVGPEAFCFTTGRGLAHTDQMLEILASVQACRDKSFQELETLVLDHVAALSGCVCVFLGWDKPRQDLVGRLQALGLPLLVLVLIDPDAPSTALDPGPLSGAPEAFRVLPLGKIEEELQKL